MISADTLIIRTLGLQDYQPVWQAMQSFTEQRTKNSNDELWLLEHQPVYTLGRNASKADFINTGNDFTSSSTNNNLEQNNIPIIQIDRGGQVTYHGPGQLVVYLLIDLKRHGLGVRQLVSLIEQSIIDTLAEYNLAAVAKKEAPGVYINEAKIAALGLRIKKGCSFHGLSLNISMDLSPFTQINPCGYKNLEVVQLSSYVEGVKLGQVQKKLVAHLINNIVYSDVSWKDGF